MAKTAKGKNSKKKNFRLKKQVRKTLGCLFMVSALLVTAIPVTPVEAGSEFNTIADHFVTSTTGSAAGVGAIPTLKPGAPNIDPATGVNSGGNIVYQTGDQRFRFVYVNNDGGEDATTRKFAVLVGYTKTQHLDNGYLEIPSTVEAYVKYTDTEGSANGLAAANKQGRPLYYAEEEAQTTAVSTMSELQADGTYKDVTTYATMQGIVRFHPCRFSDKDIWSPNDIDKPLYYWKGTGTADPNNTDDANWQMVGTADGRLRDIDVEYIGNQYAIDDGNGNYVIGPNQCSEAESVFGGTGEGMAAANIVRLKINSNLLGIGNYAFYNCNNISSIEFGNGLNTLGNWAFANCGNLTQVNMPYETMLNTFGDHAFYNCGSLQEISIPTYTEAIGDSCFENCSQLKNVNMVQSAQGGTQLQSNLKRIGYMAFRNCSSLEKLVLPKSYEGAEKGSNKNYFHLSTIRGCTSLQYISTPSEKLDFVTDAPDPAGTVDGTYDFTAFKSDVGEEFYIEAPGYVSGSNNKTKTPAHITANKEHIAFKYYGEDKYEIVESAKGKDITLPAAGSTGSPIVGGEVDANLVYAVNSNGDMVTFRVEDVNGVVMPDGNKAIGVPEIVMPNKIGKYGIVTIAEGSFNDNCWVEKITISDKVKYINSNAFKGCHNLRHIIFANAAGIETIGTDAFATQQIRTTAPAHSSGGQNGLSCRDSDENIFKSTPFLSFSGAVEKEDGTNTEPFKYAKKASSKVNAGEQPLTYITYYSGMPTNLTMKLNPDTGLMELQDFPVMADMLASADGKSGSLKNPDYGKPGAATAKDKYLFPYITDELSVLAAGVGSPSNELQTAMRNSVENIVIPAGVEAVKEGLFSGLDKNGYMLGTGGGSGSVSGNLPTDENGYVSPAPDVKSITTKTIAAIEPYTFAKMPELTHAYVSGAQKIGDYAFDDCEKLEYAEVDAATTELGLRPFSGCRKLTQMEFKDNPSFVCEEGIIFGKDAGGNKTSVIECLESRGKLPDGIGSRMVGPDELVGITSIAKEAFMECDYVIQVDLSGSSVVEIPERCFAEMQKLQRVVFPGTVAAVRAGSFWNTASLTTVVIPNNNIILAPHAFAKVDKINGVYDTEHISSKDRGDLEYIEFVANKGSLADLYQADYDYIGITQDDSLKAVYTVVLLDGFDEANPKPYKEIKVKEGENLELTILDLPEGGHEGYQFLRWSPPPERFNPIVADTEITAYFTPITAATYTVRFFDINKQEMPEYTQQVEAGKAAKAPSKDEMEVEGKVFTGWDRDFSNINANLDVYSQYTDRVDGMFYVSFWTDMDMTQMIGRVQEVPAGGSAIEPAHPTKEGYTFLRWSSDAWQNVTKDLEIFAVYTEGNGNTNNPGNPDDPNNPGNNGGGSGDGNGGGGGGGSSDSNGDDSVSGNGTKYKVVVNGGSGSGEYTAGTIVPINAYARADGTVFDKWTSSSNGVGFVSQTAISTTFTMPANNVEINANFKVGSTSSTVSGNSRSTRRNSTTSVDITKGGISNTDIASANVNGSSDNFVVKVSDDATATAAVIAALEARYGDLTNIAYMPMDISLYDATGQTKITDVSGITVDITLPLPDALIQYAGNNRAASVANGRLEDLNTKFTTIDGVPCVQFTATHFSPYTIYVDTANLTAGTIDATPKTGDPIHPKWFLAMGLACISIVLFCKKDKHPKVKHA